MPQLVKKRRSGWAVLATGALIASLLVVGASPAGADSEAQKPDEPAATSACVGAALDDHMFTDVVDEHAFAAAINCVAYYGITNGTGDGSTYSPNTDVTRAQMAVFIARAAGVAGVDLGDAMDAGFTDIGDAWQEAQDAINKLGSKGVIPKGGEFRPDDAITRAEMATFLVGLLAKASPIVTINEDGEIKLGSGAGATGNDYFADARAAVPRDNDAEITALYELGVTKGASAVPGGAPRPNVLVSTYTHAIVFLDTDGDGTPDRTRNPQGASVSATIPLILDDNGKATFSASGLIDTAPTAKADKYEVDIRVQHAPPAAMSDDNPALPYNYDPDGTVNRGQMAAFITRALAHTSARPAGITAQYADGQVVVSVRDENFAPRSNVVVDLFRIDTAGADLAFRANGSCGEVSQVNVAATTGYVCEIDITDFNTDGGGDTKTPLGDVDTGGTTVWVWTGANEAKVNADTDLFKLEISEAEATKPAARISVSTEHSGEKAHLGSSVQYTVQIQDADGEPASKYDSMLNFADAEGAALAPVLTVPGDLATATGQFTVDTVIFSTQDGVLDAGDINVKVEPEAEHAVVDDRGANNRATVTVTDQYGDPIAGVRVRLTSTDNDTDNDDTIILGSRYFAVNRDGSFSFGYERDGEVPASETLEATIEAFDHDGDPDTDALVSDNAADPLVATGQARVGWATEATTSQDTAQQIRAFDTDANTIFVGNGTGDPVTYTATDALVQVAYDSNDRFNIDRPDPDGAGDATDPPDAAASYAEFEKALSKDAGYTLTWEINGRGSRATNVWNLVIPAPPSG